MYHIRREWLHQRLPVLILSFIWIHAHQGNAIAERHESQGKYPCVFRKDSIYGGVLADCQGQGLESVPSSILPYNTTTLLLQDNSIQILNNASFVNLPHLKCLKLSQNDLKSIQASTFHGNTGLVSLDLEHNSLQLDAKSGHFPGSMFADLRNMDELSLGHNENDAVDCSVGYPVDLLKGLVTLRFLTLDTFDCPLNFSYIFENTPALSSLTVTGGATKIMNDSFDMFHFIQLKSLCLSDMFNLMSVGPDAFRYFKYLDDLSITGGRLSVEGALESLAPLTNRSLVSLHIGGINNGGNARDMVCGVVTRYMTRYLTQMCIQHVELTSCGLMYIEFGAFSIGTWPHCLLSLDISGNPLVGSALELMDIKRFHVLRSFIFTNRKFSFLARKHYADDPYDTLTCLPRDDSIEIKDSRNRKLITESNPDRFESVPFITGVTHGSRLRSNLQANHSNHAEFKHRDAMLTNMNSEIVPDDGDNATGAMVTFTKVWLPPNITYINMNEASNNEGSLDQNFTVKGGENLLELHVSDSGIHSFVCMIIGVQNVQILDISKNDGSNMAPIFFDTAPKLRKLYMSQMKLDNTWILNNGLDVFSKLKELIVLDLSGNGLHVIYSNTFSMNKKLAVLSLARNHLKTIPVDLRDHPDMCLLDLRSNSILRLNERDIDMLEAHRQNMKSFSLWLHGNVFSCGCSNLRFISWLHRTKIHLDADRNYGCILENGNVTTMQELQSLKNLWRECNGKTAFLISLIVASLLLLAYCLLFIGMKFETHLKASLVKFIGRTLPLKTRRDYDYDVYIGYSDDDIDLACQYLRNSIENSIGYRRTYLRHRDLIPASDMAESIVTAIDSSWRVVLVMTEQFLQEDWSFLSVKWAIHSVQDANPDRLVLVFISHQLPRNPILTSVLKIVPERNIVYLTDTAGNSEMSPHEERMVANALGHLHL